jgi:cytochrome c oxidase assembly factor CtaG
MQWWCSASNTAWTWSWRPYPGVWLFLGLIALAIGRWNRVGDARRWKGTLGNGTMTHSGTTGSSVVIGGGPPADMATPLHPLFIVGLLVLWLALDWPIGALGAGYLASVHMLQFLLIALVAPPLLLRGPSPAAFAMLDGESIVARVITRLTAPGLALILFNAIVLLTHIPAIVDGLMVTQFGSMLVDLLWLLAGILFWWPLVAPVPTRPRFPPPLRMLYIIIGLMFSPVMFGLVGFLVYAETPLYGIFELAPPMSGLSSREDHQLAGVMMSVGGATIAFIAISIIFFRWNQVDG